MIERVTSIKRFVVVLLCLALALPFACYAEVNPDDFWFEDDSGNLVYDADSYNYAVACEMVDDAGFSIVVYDYWKTVPDAEELTYYFDWDEFKADYDAMVEAVSTPAIEPPTAAPTEPPTEVSEEEPLVMEDDYATIDDSLSEEPVDSPILEVPESNPVLELEEDNPMVYVVNDMRGGSDDVENIIADGLKGVIQSIFGVYEPVTTTAVYTETVNGETVTTLVDVVADGSAGVDYEYVSGVVLFGIMLFCLFKLLGGILK